MARQIVERLWCDWHDILIELKQFTDDRVAADLTVSVTLAGSMPVDIDVCAECNHSVFGPLEALIERGRASENLSRPPRGRPRSNGSREPRPSEADAEWQCKLCETGGPYTNKTSLVEHIWREHVGRPKPATPLRCPECNRTFDAPNATARHRTNQHGWDRVNDAYDNVPKGRR